MAAARRGIEISIGEEGQLEATARSQTAPASWVERTRILLAYRTDPSTYAVGEGDLLFLLVAGVEHADCRRRLRE